MQDMLRIAARLVGCARDRMYRLAGRVGRLASAEHLAPTSISSVERMAETTGASAANERSGAATTTTSITCRHVLRHRPNGARAPPGT
jgi:hypothetical protein